MVPSKSFLFLVVSCLYAHLLTKPFFVSSHRTQDNNGNKSLDRIEEETLADLGQKPAARDISDASKNLFKKDTPVSQDTNTSDGSPLTAATPPPPPPFNFQCGGGRGRGGGYLQHCTGTRLDGSGLRLRNDTLQQHQCGGGGYQASAF
jgi:hypothetical protein